MIAFLRPSRVTKFWSRDLSERRITSKHRRISTNPRTHKKIAIRRSLSCVSDLARINSKSWYLLVPKLLP